MTTRLRITRKDLLEAIQAGTVRELVATRMKEAGTDPKDCPGCFDKLMKGVERLTPKLRRI